MRSHGHTGAAQKVPADSKHSPRPEQLLQYVEQAYQLIPLHRWDSTSNDRRGHPRQDGKRPRDKDWTNRPYKAADMLAHASGGGNVGVRLSASQLVIDVDRRNMPDGRDTFQELCRAVGLDPDECPCVRTGSGGLHVYMTKPPDVAVVDSVEGYDGVEFKTLGRQVVAAGSVHPSGGAYSWDPLCPPLSSTPVASDRLLALIRRPQASSSSGAGGGEYSQSEVASMLDGLDPMDFKDHDRWLTLMQACHHASNGEARSEFIEWSTRDPAYADDAWTIGRRWDSLHRSRPGGVVTHRTLDKFLRDAGKDALIPRSSPHDDFAGELGEDDNSGLPEHERKGLLEQMNDRYCVAVDGGTVRVMYDQLDPSDGNRKWISLRKGDFMDLLCNRRLEKPGKKPGQTVTVTVAEEWFKWGRRRTAKGVVFDPERSHPGFLNLWTGWAVEPAPGDWSLMKELIADVLCAGDPEAVSFVMRWLAYMVQNPAQPPEVAICFHGKKGTGKSTLGRSLVALAGRHGRHLTSSEHITGRFNSHLRSTVFMFADEAVAPVDRQAQARLKAMITERQLEFEAKGKDVVSGPNRLHVMVASNHDWFVDAGTTDGERRYFVSRVSDSRREDIGFFAALHRQMYERGGLSAMLHDLQLTDLHGWAPRGNVPQSAALMEQKLRNAEPVVQWWFNHLDAGEPPCQPYGCGGWPHSSMRAFVQDLRNSFEDFCRTNGLRVGSMNRSVDRYFWGELRGVCHGLEDKRDPIPPERADLRAIGDTGRARSVAIPSLIACREMMESALGGRIAWKHEAEEDPLA